MMVKFKWQLLTAAPFAAGTSHMVASIIIKPKKNVTLSRRMFCPHLDINRLSRVRNYVESIEAIKPDKQAA